MKDDMNNIAQTEKHRVIIGVDTHLDNHVASAVDTVGLHLGDFSLRANPTGYQDVVSWAKDFGEIESFGLEGTGCYGAGLARYLSAEGIKVIEINRPDRSTRHQKGKSDPIDAQSAARAVLAQTATNIPKTGNDTVEMIRVLRVARNTAVKAKTQTINALKALVVTAPSELREQLRETSTVKLIATVVAFKPGGIITPTAATRLSMRILGRRHVELTKEIKELDVEVDRLSLQASPELRELQGVGPEVAAALLQAAGDNPERVASEASFAQLCGVAPLPASSGKTTRHRLNRGGNRQANSALYRIVVVRLRWHQPTKDYMKKRLTENKTKPEIIRCLKRYVAREVFAVLRASDDMTNLSPST